MMQGHRLLLILMLLLCLVTSSGAKEMSDKSTVTVDTEFNSTSNKLPLHFWRANEKIFNVTDSEIFPHMSMTGSLADLGIGWIAWTVKIGESYMPMKALLLK